MNTQSNALPDHALHAEAVTPVPASGLQLLLWSVRRELWEYRFLYVVPLVIAGIAPLAFTFSAFAGIWEPRLRLNPAQPQAPYDLAAGLLMAPTSWSRSSIASTHFTASAVTAASCSGNRSPSPTRSPCSRRPPFRSR